MYRRHHRAPIYASASAWRGSMNDKFRQTLGDRRSFRRSMRYSALALIRVRQLLPHPRHSLRPISIRGAGSAILLNARSALSSLSVVTLVTRSPRVTCGMQVSTHAERAGAGAAAGEPTDSSCQLRARAREPWRDGTIVDFFAGPNSVFPYDRRQSSDSRYELSD